MTSLKMTSPNLTKLAPVALLMLAGAFNSPTASADPSKASVETFKASLTYNAAQPAAAVYSDLEHAALRACESLGTRSLHVRVQEQKCAAQVLGAAVQKISRPDVAQIYASRFDRG